MENRQRQVLRTLTVEKQYVPQVVLKNTSTVFNNNVSNYSECFTYVVVYSVLVKSTDSGARWPEI